MLSKFIPKINIYLIKFSILQGNTANGNKKFAAKADVRRIRLQLQLLWFKLGCESLDLKLILFYVYTVRIGALRIQIESWKLYM